MELTAADTVADFHGIPFSSAGTDLCLLNQIAGKSNVKCDGEKNYGDFLSYPEQRLAFTFIIRPLNSAIINDNTRHLYSI